jgi:hypothetical protein
MICRPNQALSIGFAAWLVVAIGAPAPVSAQDDEKIEEALVIFNKAKYLHREDRLDEAIQEYQRAQQSGRALLRDG